MFMLDKSKRVALAILLLSGSLFCSEAEREKAVAEFKKQIDPIFASINELQNECEILCKSDMTFENSQEFVDFIKQKDELEVKFKEQRIIFENSQLLNELYSQLQSTSNVLDKCNEKITTAMRPLLQEKVKSLYADIAASKHVAEHVLNHPTLIHEKHSEECNLHVENFKKSLKTCDEFVGQVKQLEKLFSGTSSYKKSYQDDFESIFKEYAQLNEEPFVSQYRGSQMAPLPLETVIPQSNQNEGETKSHVTSNTQSGDVKTVAQKLLPGYDIASVFDESGTWKFDSDYWKLFVAVNRYEALSLAIKDELKDPDKAAELLSEIDKIFPKLKQELFDGYAKEKEYFENIVKKIDEMSLFSVLALNNLQDKLCRIDSERRALEASYGMNFNYCTRELCKEIQEKCNTNSDLLALIDAKLYKKLMYGYMAIAGGVAVAGGVVYALYQKLCNKKDAKANQKTVENNSNLNQNR